MFRLKQVMSGYRLRNYGTRTAVIEEIAKPSGPPIVARVDYRYDNLYRLTYEHRYGSNPEVAYEYNFAYDSAGNRTSWQVVGVGTTIYTHDAANKMLTAGSSTFTYDDKGNTRLETNGGTVTQYTWDIQNRLTQWAKTNRTTETYIYNADGMRVRKTPSGGTATDFLLDFTEIAEEITGNSVISYVGPTLISRIEGETRTIYHADGIGSTRAISDSSELVTQAEVYDAYGNRLTTAGPAPVFGFAGHFRYFADATALEYIKARYYDPSNGRFISMDPIGYGGGMNLYSYAQNRPTGLVDPTGLRDQEHCLQDYTNCLRNAQCWAAGCKTECAWGIGTIDGIPATFFCGITVRFPNIGTGIICGGLAIGGAALWYWCQSSCSKGLNIMMDSCEFAYNNCLQMAAESQNR